MSQINILHVSDLHISNRNRHDRSQVAQALIKDVADLRSQRGMEVDLAIFSGDLVLAGETQDDFSLAQSDFLKPLAAAANLPLSRVFLACGNHDIDRMSVRTQKYIDLGLQEELATRDAINIFVQQICDADPSTSAAVQRVLPFSKFLAANTNEHLIKSTYLYQSYSMTCRGIVIGIVCFNSAWRATGEGEIDKGRLLIGPRTVELAHDDIRESQLKIAVMHHPVAWLSEIEAPEIERLIARHFNALFTGHLHFATPEAKQTVSGNYIWSSTGSVFDRRDFFNGYQFTKIDTARPNAAITFRTYYPDRSQFGVGENVIEGGEWKFSSGDESSDNLIGIDGFVAKARSYIRDKANKHFVMLEDTLVKRGDIREAFICPPLSPTALYSPAYAHPKGKTRFHSVEEILRARANTVIFGARESGKSTLGHYMACVIADGGVVEAPLTALIDASALRKGADPLLRLIRRYYADLEPKPEMKKVFETLEGTIFVDGFNVMDVANTALLLSEIAKFPNLRFILLSAQAVPAIARIRKEGSEFEKWGIYFIHPLSRNSIRKITENWCKSSNLPSDAAYSRVMQQINDSNLPRTGYIVSLLLWAIERRQAHDRVNEAVLLENILDHLLSKHDFKTSLRGEYDFRAKELTLQLIAKLLKDRAPEPMGLDEMISFVHAFLVDKSLDFSAAKILDGFVKCGVLKLEDDFVTFKYTFFGEFFLARHFTEHPEKMRAVIESGDSLKFARELEFAAALSRENVSLCEQLYDQVLEKCPDAIDKRDVNELQSIKISADVSGHGKERLRYMKNNRLSPEQIDRILDRADRQIIEVKARQMRKATTRRGADAELTQSDYSLILELFGRVVRNAEFVNKDLKKKYCVLLFQRHVQGALSAFSYLDEILEEAIKVYQEEGMKLEPAFVEFVKSVVRVCGFAAGTMMVSDAIASEKLAGTLTSIIDDGDVPLGVRLIALFVFLDIRGKDWTKSWTDFLKSHDARHFTFRTAVERLFLFYRSRHLPDEERDRLLDLIADLEVSLGLPKGQKGARMQELRKDKLIDGG